ncbi:MAG: TCR/Tet family MFS transporter [Leptolyngbyaceae cyanobacterium SM1_4_3]|nr:TCR/Tet family MFS transporter [Leptolyngbyaceae cyanobacterium SM1_4_3]
MLNTPINEETPKRTPRLLPPFTLFVGLIAYLGIGVLNPIMPALIEGRYGGTAFYVGLMYTTLAAAQFISSPVIGLVSDRYGRLPILLFSLLGAASADASSPGRSGCNRTQRQTLRVWRRTVGSRAEGFCRKLGIQPANRRLGSIAALANATTWIESIGNWQPNLCVWWRNSNRRRCSNSDPRSTGIAYLGAMH